ncbi:MAG: flagellar basal-body rod protein FlgG [Magnetococcales bacterium]|nr:flagellar basal-body rod protein FlgG [Magnetococcales bacterium]MBF0116158.1 flagellar basal-body rod protein FlgG [Magnetococcales bacterium]
MIRSLWTAATGLQSQQLNIDVISNNLANVNTSGFKYSRASFQDLLYANLRPAGSETAQTGAAVPAGIQLGHGVKPVAVTKEFTQGSAIPTSEDAFNVDLFISGQGFFQIERPDGTIAYTRDGHFTINKDGNMVTADGLQLVGGTSVKQQSDIAVMIESSGIIKRVDANNTQSQVSQIQLANFVNPAGLTAIGNNLFVESLASGTPILSNADENGMGSLKQHVVEQSNVNMVSEMVEMIATQRAYEIGTKSIQTADSMLGLIAQLKR